MMQEVQTGVGVYELTTIETIEAVGTSSPKIIEGRQTKGGHYISECDATGTVRINWKTGDERQTLPAQSTDWEVTSTSGKQEFITVDNGIRIPAAGSYEATLYWGGRGATIYIENEGNGILYTKEFEWADGVQSETVTFTFTAGKFDLITLWGAFYYGGSSDYATLSFNYQPTLTIRQL